jgi:hypothetical protein
MLSVSGLGSVDGRLINDCGTAVVIKIGRGNRRTRRKLALVPLCPCSEAFVRNLFMKWAFKIYMIKLIIIAGFTLVSQNRSCVRTRVHQGSPSSSLQTQTVDIVTMETLALK